MMRKVFLALAVVVAPIGATTAVGVVGGVGGGVAGADVPAPTNITCAVAGTVTFAKPGLSAGGALTKNTTVKSKASVTPTGSGCSGLPSSLVIPSDTTLCPTTSPGVPDPSGPGACQAATVKKGVTTYGIATKPYYYDTVASFATDGSSDLAAALEAKPIKTVVDGLGVELAYGTADEALPGGVCGADVGFDLSGNVLYKNNPITTYSLTACISGDAGTGTTGDFVADLASPTAVVASATVGASSALTIGLPNAECALTGSVTFAKPGLSAGGALTSSTSEKTSSALTPTGTYCSGAQGKGTIPSATTLCPTISPGVPDPSGPAACQATTVKKGVTTYDIATKPYYYDTISGYVTSGLSNLEASLEAKPLKTTINGIGLVLQFGSASTVLPGGACGASAVGFALSGDALMGTTPVGTYAATICITGDTGTGTSGSFLTDLGSSTAVIATGVIGGNSSLIVTFDG